MYDELRKLAAGKLASEKPGDTLSATALVHEVWLKLADASVKWQDRTHFFRTAATAMRRILVDRAKRDGGVQLELPDFATPLSDPQVVAVDDALTRLAETKPDHAKMIEL